MNEAPAAHPESSTSTSGFGVIKQLAQVQFDWLLLAMPVAIVLEVMHAPAAAIFVVAALAIVPLAGLMGRATENLAETVGAGLGGLMNATFGNAAELIIALMALAEGPAMFGLVKASLAGYIIGNVLLVLGVSFVAGGLKFKRQTFNPTAAGMGATMMIVAATGMLIPTLYYGIMIEMQEHGQVPAAAAPAAAGTTGVSDKMVGEVVSLSEEISIVLFATYVLSLWFSLKTHSHLFGGPEDSGSGEHHEPEWNRKTSVIVLLLATVGVAIMAEFLVSSVDSACEALGMSKIFVGVIVVAVIGNAAEHSTAVMVAMKNKMDLAVNIAIGSSMQIALFVAPVLVFASWIMHSGPGEFPPDLHFTMMEVIAIMIAVLVLLAVSQDGESHWMEGGMLVSLYAILGLAFFHLPDVALEGAAAAAESAGH